MGSFVGIKLADYAASGLATRSIDSSGSCGARIVASGPPSFREDRP
jgi:hypothetical protein